jgi:phage anti-repressor protein
MTTPIQQPPGDATASNQNPSQEATVDAKLLHAYVGHPLSYDPWIAGVRRMDSSRYARITGHRVFDSEDGKTVLSLSFASELALPGGTLAEAIPLIIIAENPRAPQGTVNAELRRFHSVVVAGGLSDARRLHEFLQVRQDYDGWITSKRKELRMKSGRDYHRLPIGDIKPGYWHNEPNARAKDIAVTFRMAQEIAMREQTPRGERVRWHVESCQRTYSAYNKRYESNLY